jgi:hypothetical protein
MVDTARNRAALCPFRPWATVQTPVGTPTCGVVVGTSEKTTQHGTRLRVRWLIRAGRSEYRSTRSPRSRLRRPRPPRRGWHGSTALVPALGLTCGASDGVPGDNPVPQPGRSRMARTWQSEQLSCQDHRQRRDTFPAASRPEPLATSQQLAEVREQAATAEGRCHW